MNKNLITVGVIPRGLPRNL